MSCLTFPDLKNITTSRMKKNIQLNYLNMSFRIKGRKKKEEFQFTWKIWMLLQLDINSAIKAFLSLLLTAAEQVSD